MNDAGKKAYTVYPYNPAIYNYDYAYLFQARGKDVPYDPGNTLYGSDLVYLILPQTSQKIKEDFIESRTSKVRYTTGKVWKIADVTTIIKRIIKSFP